jgi:hypothetical protein
MRNCSQRCLLGVFTSPCRPACSLSSLLGVRAAFRRKYVLEGVGRVGRLHQAFFPRKLAACKDTS